MSAAFVDVSSTRSVSLGALLTSHGVTDAGQDLVRRVRSGQPVRAGDGRAGNVTGRYPSRKMGVIIQYESRNVEFAFVMLCETDPAVHEYYDQPCELSLDYKTKGRRVVVSHTPDFLVLGTEYAGFVECKTADALPKLAAKSPLRYVADGNGGWRCPPGEAAAERYGLGYRVWTPAGVSRAFIDNLRFLEAEWGRSTRTFPDDDLRRALDLVGATPGVSLEELVHEIADPDLVYWCIFRHHVYVDLAAHLLSQQDRVRVFVDASAAAVWSAAIASVPEIHQSAADVLARARLKEYSPEALAVAAERYMAIRPAVEDRQPSRFFKGPGCYTSRRRLLDYRKAEREGGLGLVALCPKVHLRGNSKPRFPPETYEILHDVAVKEYENATNVTAKIAYGKAADRCADEGVPCPSYSTFLKLIKKREAHPATAGRKGMKAAAAAAPAFGPRDPSVQGQGPMDIVHIDHTELDVLVRVGPGTDASKERLWLTLAICTWSRCIVGYDLSFDPPAVAGLFTAYRDLLDRQGRIPNRTVVDRGPEFGSVAFDLLCAAGAIDNARRPAARPKSGSVVERMFGTTNTQFVHALRGNTQLLKNPRGMSREVDPAGHAVWRLAELDAALQRFLFDVYPRQPHAGLDGMTPRARFLQGVETIGSGKPLTGLPDLRFLLWPPSRRGDATVDPRTGILVEYIRYWHPDMRSEALRRKKVPVRVDPHDLSHVVAFIAGRWVLCQAERAADFKDRSRRELRLAAMELRFRRRGAAKRQAIRVAELVPMLRDLAQTEAGLLQKQRDAERREVLEARGLHLAGGRDAPLEDHPSGDTDWNPRDLDDLGPGIPL